MYDPSSETHEFIGRDRSEALAKAVAFFGADEGALAVADVDPGRISGLGSRVAIVVYRREAGPPSRRPSERSSERAEPRRGRDGRRERGGEDGGARRSRSPRPDRFERQERSERPERASRAELGDREEPPSKATATTALTEIGQFVAGVLERMGIGSFEIAESSENGELVVLQIHGAAALALASGDGRAVDAVQLLANQASMRAGGDDARRVVVDVEGNADQRAAFLARIADRAAQRARETGRPVALEAMSPKDRRTVHVALRDVEGIATMSVGEGRYRQVVVVPDNSPEYEEAKRYEAQSQRESRD